MTPLDSHARDQLLEQARQIAARLPPSGRRQAASAEAILRRFGSERLVTMLDLDLPAGGSAKPWSVLRKELKPLVPTVLDRYGEEGLRFLLGWIRRYPTTSAPQGPGHHPAPGGRRRV